MKSKRFYVYVHKIKSTGEVFYVGKGTRDRLSSTSKRSEKWKEIAENNDWVYEKYMDNMDEESALILESDLVQELRPSANVITIPNMRKPINKEYVLSMYTYDETSPSGLIYKQDNNGINNTKRFKGEVAGYLGSSGYFSVLNETNSRVLAHRVVWYLVYGEDPGVLSVDHIDGNRSNNKICNLRLLVQSQNQLNIPLKSNNRSGFNGVHEEGSGFVVTWVTSEGLKRKRISIRKYGKELAFAMACYYRRLVTKQSAVKCRQHTDDLEFQILSKYTESEIIDMIESDKIMASNKSGTKGVSFNGSTGYPFWTFRLSGCFANFSVQKFGDDVAKAFAIECSRRFNGENEMRVCDYSLEETNNIITIQLKHRKFPERNKLEQ